jgi:hypothetical protein
MLGAARDIQGPIQDLFNRAFSPFTDTPLPEVPAIWAPHFVDAGAYDGSEAGVDSPAMYSNAAIGDLAFVVIQTSNDVAPTISAGWTEVPGSPVGTGSACPDADTCTALTVFYQVLTSTTPAREIDYGAGDHYIGFTFGYKVGTFDASDPFEDNTSSNTQTAGTSLTIPGFVTENDRSMVVVIFNNPHDGSGTNWVGSPANATLTNPDTLADGKIVIFACNNKNTGDGGGNCVLAGINETAGASGTTTGTLQWSHTSVSLSFGINGEPSS